MSEHTYTFYPPNADKPGILFQYLNDNYPLFLYGKGDGVTYSITFKRQLSTEELEEFTQWIMNWVSPEQYLVFNRAETFSLNTERLTSSQLEVLNTFIMPGYDPNKNDGTILASIKTIVEYSTENIESFAAIEEAQPHLITLQIFSLTANVVVHEETIDISPVFLQWKQKALNGETGKEASWKSYQVFGLNNILPKSDSIWQWKASTTSPIRIALNGQQRLYYDIIS